MAGFVHQIELSIGTRELLKRGQSVLVAVSGGVDSMVLLEVLRRLAPVWNWKLGVAHFNHALRGPDSDADEAFVREAAGASNLPFFAGRGNVRAFAESSRFSVEMAARHLRHEFLARIAREGGYPTVALGHQADDQVELFFLRLLRGATGQGLSGMAWKAASPADASVELVRPLLDLARAAIGAFAAEAQIQFREDASNNALDHRRNRIRHDLLSRLRREYQPALTRVVLRQMELLRDEHAIVSAEAEEWLKDANRRPFSELPTAVQREAVASQLIRLGVSPEFDCIEQLRNNPAEPATVASGVRLQRSEAGEVTICSAARTSFSCEECVIDLEATPASAQFGGLEIRWEMQDRAAVAELSSAAGCEWFDLKKVGRTVRLRHWRPGDRFQPIGMPAPTKLQDLFVNVKIPRDRRRELVLAATERGEIFWVEGLRISEPFKLREQSERALKWQWARNWAGHDRPA